MNKLETIGIDVDLTLTDTVMCENGWFDYMKARCTSFDEDTFESDQYNHNIDYNLASYFTFPEVICPYDYWRDENLYEDKVPFDGAQDIIRALAKDYNILYISTCKGNHHKSKVEWLKRYFPKFDGFFATKEKHWIPVDIMIDDRVDILNKSNARMKLLMDSPYRQKESPDVDVDFVDSWIDIWNKIVGEDIYR